MARCVTRDDNPSGVNATLRKDEIQSLIEDQLELGEDGLEEEEKCLLEINLDDLTMTSGKTQTYWLLPIQAARDARVLRENETNTNTAGQTTQGECRDILISTKNIACHEQDLTTFNSCCNPGEILVGE